MEKLDLQKQYKEYYTAKPEPQIINLEEVAYLSVEGRGDPSGPGFEADIQSLYPVAYALKFMCKELGKDFVVAKLEGQWWYDAKFENVSMEDAPRLIPRSHWCYRLLIRMPSFVTPQLVHAAIESTVKKKKLPATSNVRLITLNEGKVVQMLHTGPFDSEPETLLKMKDFMQEYNLLQNGLHHEIYLSDFRKTAPEKLKTILREPVK